MSMTLEPVRPIELSEIRAAREQIAKTIVRTPLIRLELGPEFPDIRLKLENLQPINAYKLRGAANAVAMLPQADRKRGRPGRCHRQHWRRRVNHGRGQCNQGAETGNKSIRRRTGNRSAGSAFVRKRFAAGFSKLEILIRGWCRRSKHVPSHVGKNE